MITPAQAAAMAAAVAVMAALLNMGVAAISDRGWWTAVVVVAGLSAAVAWLSGRKR